MKSYTYESVSIKNRILPKSEASGDDRVTYGLPEVENYNEKETISGKRIWKSLKSSNI